MSGPVGVDLGDVLKFVEIVSIVGTGLIVVYRMGGAIQQFKIELSTMQKTLDKLVEAQREQIQNTVRIDSLAMLVSELRRDYNNLREGRGWIQDKVDGEYPRR